MIITGNRIRSLNLYLGLVPQNTQVIIGKSLQGVAPNVLTRIGFAVPPVINTAVVPGAVFGPISRFNSFGKEVPNRNAPMELAHRTVWRRWEDWHGNEHSGYVTMSYHRYPRIVIPPPGIEFRVSATTQGEELIMTPRIMHDAANAASILHRINLFLEIFNECEVFTENLERIIQAPVVRLNWDLLPRGQYPWDRVITTLQPIINRARPVEHQIIRDRLDTINAHDPAFVAIGRAGFSGYVIFGFPVRNLFLMESIHFGNATYGLGQNWQALSQMTKAEILDQHLHTHRIIHRDDWHANIEQLFV